MKPGFEEVHSWRAVLGEGPVWDSASRNIYWIDIARGEIMRYGPESGQFAICQVRQMVGSIALRAGGGLIAALRRGISFIDFEQETEQGLVNPESELPDNRFNDGKCDPAGRFWAGTMNLDEKSPTGSLYMLDADLKISLKISSTTISNGMSWNTAGNMFYFIDSPTSCVAAFDFDLDSGEIRSKRRVIEVPKEMGYPDGMTIDEEGMLWTALFNGWGVARWDPRTGKLLERVRVPVAKVSCCTFGGPDLKDLYISTASINLDPKELEQQPLAGALLVIPDCGYKGMPAQAFRG